MDENPFFLSHFEASSYFCSGLSPVTSRDPKARIQILKNAGELKIPMTTGILVGIGENEREIIDSLFTIKKLHEQFENIQEVILQNFVQRIYFPRC